MRTKYLKMTFAFLLLFFLAILITLISAYFFKSLIMTIVVFGIIISAFMYSFAAMIDEGYFEDEKK